MNVARVLLAVGLVSAAASGRAQAGPPEKTTSRFRGLEGYALFSQSDGCTYDYITVYAIEEMTQSGPGGPAPTAYTAVFLNSWDWCTGQNSGGYGWDTGAVIRGSAVQSLVTEATIPMTVCSSAPPDWQQTCASQTLLVDLAWAANGENASQGQSTQHTSSPYMTVHSRSVGSMTTADVAGTLLLDGTDLLATMTWRAGGLSRTREGEITFIRY
jgi:hypothetical protein